MSLVRRCLLSGAGVLVLLGCNGGGDTSSTGPGGGSASASSTTASTGGAGGTAAGTGGAPAGTGGAGTTSTASGTGGGGVAIVPSGFSCSGAKPSIAAVAQITAKNCLSSGACHLAMQSANGLYQMLVGRIAEECTDNRLMVNPGDPEHSYVIQKITDHNLCAGEPPMPLDGTPLASADIQTVYDWICEGAPDK